MADYIIEESSLKDNRASGFAYSDVPAGNNAAGTPWQTVAVEYVTKQRGGTTAQAQSLPAAIAQAQLDSGAKYEWAFSVEFDANESNANKQAAVEAAIVAEETVIITQLQNLLRFWGFEGVTT